MILKMLPCLFVISLLYGCVDDYALPSQIKEGTTGCEGKEQIYHKTVMDCLSYGTRAHFSFIQCQAYAQSLYCKKEDGAK